MNALDEVRKAKRLAEVRRRYARRMAAGQCVMCCAPLGRGMTRCDACLDDAKRRRHANIETDRAKRLASRARRVSMGECWDCRGRVKTTGDRYCPGCLAARNEMCRDRYYRRQAAGKCGRCGTREPEPGRKTCEPCLQARRDFMAAWRERRRQREKANGS